MSRVAAFKGLPVSFFRVNIASGKLVGSRVKELETKVRPDEKEGPTVGRSSRGT
jgi:hypothetical protein